MSDPGKAGDLLAQIPKSKGLPPVHLWNPDFCGDIDMRIARDGTWFYQGTPIGRPALVRRGRRRTDRVHRPLGRPAGTVRRSGHCHLAL